MDLKTFQRCMTEAPCLLDQIALLLQECQEKEILLPRGICNLCDLSWEELSDLPQDAKPLHQPKVFSRPLRTGHLPPDTCCTMSMVPSHVLLPNESSMSVRQATTRCSTFKFKKRFHTERENNGATCVPVTSTLRLYLEEHLSHLSFSLTYRATTPCFSSQTLEVCHWAVDKLQPILDQIKEEKDMLVVTGNTFLLSTKHYPEDKFNQPLPPFQRFAGDGLFPIIPNTKYMGSATSLKLHYSLPDGTSYVYYPSGSVAVCQIPSTKTRGGIYTNIFGDSPNDNLLASFMPSGHGYVYHTGKPTTSWFAFLVNDVISLTFSKHFSMDVTFTALGESVTLKIKEKPLASSSRVQDPGAEEEKLAVSRAELQVIRKRVRHTALHWLNFYMVAAGLIKEPLLQDPKPRSLKHKEPWTSPPRVHLGNEESPPAFVRPAPLRRKLPRPATCSLPMSRTSPLFRRASHRAKSAGSLCMSSRSALHRSETPAPPCLVVLRHLLLNTYKGQGCHCSTRLPALSDLELELFLGGPWARPGQVIVVYVTSSVCPPPRGQSAEQVLQTIHHKQVSTSAMPCAKSSRNPFRLVKYDLDTATHLTQTAVPVLVQRHHVGPGILLSQAGWEIQT
ncbi:uncharacterized protein C3orf20 homolog [Osmerus mordax]|uniref:uncharacterized protein C3orf20 homolog n=1 Tax=Osmerus mordax TaxID=8014 RepID=UPI00350F44B5